MVGGVIEPDVSEIVVGLRSSVFESGALKYGHGDRSPYAGRGFSGMDQLRFNSVGSHGSEPPHVRDKADRALENVWGGLIGY